MRFNAVELAIITRMRRRPDKWFSTNELADSVHVAWETSDKALKSLFKKGYLLRGKKKKRVYWKLYT
ncbi:MAG: hypothetical protein KAT05_17440 [Spirochaetes bacterium]|nr:hypothetical protein [Spirochaetota bacterium]